MKPRFEEHLYLALAKLGRKLELYQGRRVDKARAKLDKLRMGQIDIAVIKDDAFTEYRLIKRDRIEAAIDAEYTRLADANRHATALKAQAQSLLDKARAEYKGNVNALTEQREAIYTEKLA